MDGVFFHCGGVSHGRRYYNILCMQHWIGNLKAGRANGDFAQAEISLNLAIAAYLAPSICMYDYTNPLKHFLYHASPKHFILGLFSCAPLHTSERKLVPAQRFACRLIAHRWIITAQLFKLKRSLRLTPRSEKGKRRPNPSVEPSTTDPRSLSQGIIPVVICCPPCVSALMVSNGRLTTELRRQGPNQPAEEASC